MKPKMRARDQDLPEEQDNETQFISCVLWS